MSEAILFAVIASVALPIGAVFGVWTKPPKRLTASLLAFASGALITAVAFELFNHAFEAGEWRAGVAFALGAATFILVDLWLDKRVAGGAGSSAMIGFGLLAGVTLDGIPENVAMGVALVEGTTAALLVAIFVSNLPEAVVGAQKMRESGLSAARTLTIWVVAAIFLALAVVAGYALFENLGENAISWPMGFAAGAVLASLSITLMPEAFEEGGPLIAFATALGFLASYLISAG